MDFAVSAASYHIRPDQFYHEKNCSILTDHTRYTIHSPQKNFQHPDRQIHPNCSMIQVKQCFHISITISFHFCLLQFYYTDISWKFGNIILTSWKFVELNASTCGKACPWDSKFLCKILNTAHNYGLNWEELYGAKTS